MNRRRLLRVGAGGVLATVSGCLGLSDKAGDRGDREDITVTLAGPSLESSPRIASPAFEDGDGIPTRYTCDGADESPRVRIEGVPESASSLALVVDDPDAPGGTFTHWLLWDIPTSTETIPEGIPHGDTVASLNAARQGTNDAGQVGYSGPCPPEDDPVHRYRFLLIALGARLELEPSAERAAFDNALTNVAQSHDHLVGEYIRSS